MPKAHFEIYRAQVFELAKTLVFKSLATALTINEELKALGHVINDEDYASWKYYMNLAGQYHSYDTVMTVVSLDTLQTIEFTTQNLQIHRATAAAYAFGSRYYEELVARYPQQETLIQRILNPIDLQTAIEAENGAILWYNAALVESNETNLIPRLQTYLDNVIARWNVSAYQTTDDLYVPAFLAMIYNFLPIAIMNIRNGNCHTRYAHSFHIREFLTSHGQLTPFLEYLTKKQLLWLYRNIRYIQRNPGRQDTLDWMIDNLLTPRQIPLAQWDMAHDLAEMPEELYPSVLFERTPMNFGYHFAGVDTKTIDQMLDDEQPVARGNIRVQPATATAMQQQMETSIRNAYRTKVLESAMLDTTDAIVFPFTDFVLNHWLYLSQTGRYNTYVTFDDPRTGEATTITVRDAFTIFLFALNKRYGIVLETIPDIEAKLVRRMVKPTVAQIRAITSARHLPQSTLDALLDIPAVENHISIAGFRDNVKAMHEGLMRQWFIWTQIHNYEGRGQAEIAALHCYHDAPVTLGNDTDGTIGSRDYQQWFSDKGLPYWGYDSYECERLAAMLLTQCTGADLSDATSMREMQQALIRLLARLSSYTVQFLTRINQSKIKMVDWNFVQHGDAFSNYDAHFEANVIDVDVVRLLAESISLEQLNIYRLGTDFTLNESAHGEVAFDHGVSIKPEHTAQVEYRMLLSDLKVQNVDEHFDDFEADTPVRETQEYRPLEYLELSDAFMALSTEHYVMYPEDRPTVEVRWLERATDLDGKISFRDAALTAPELLGGQLYPVQPPALEDEAVVTASSLQSGIVQEVATVNTETDQIQTQVVLLGGLVKGPSTGDLNEDTVQTAPSLLSGRVYEPPMMQIPEDQTITTPTLLGGSITSEE